MMRWRLFVLLLVVIAVMAGSPYAALVLNRVMGPWSVVAHESDGSNTTMQFGQNLPRPSWVPVPSGAGIVQSSHLVSKAHPDGFDSLELAVHTSFEDTRKFYLDHLAAAGFAIDDIGTGTLNAAAARYLGIAGQLFGKRDATGDRISVDIRTQEGLIVPSRLIQIHWWKTIGHFAVPDPREARNPTTP